MSWRFGTRHIKQGNDMGVMAWLGSCSLPIMRFGKAYSGILSTVELDAIHNLVSTMFFSVSASQRESANSEVDW